MGDSLIEAKMKTTFEIIGLSLLFLSMYYGALYLMFLGGLGWLILGILSLVLFDWLVHHI